MTLAFTFGLSIAAWPFSSRGSIWRANVIAAGIRNPDITFRPDMSPEWMLAGDRRFQASLAEGMDRLAVLGSFAGGGEILL